MANVLFTRTSDPNSKPITDGQLIFDTSGNGKMYLDNGTERLEMGGALTVDATLSKTSTNPVQNKAVAGVMLDTLSDIDNVTSKGFLADALAIKELNSSLESIKIKTLWTNPELDGSSNLSAFNQQTIDINGISDYDIIGICHSNYGKDLTTFNLILNIPNKNQIINMTYFDYDEDHYIAGYSRNFTILENGISFTSAYSYWIKGNTEDNRYAIPIKIIGIKL